MEMIASPRQGAKIYKSSPMVDKSKFAVVLSSECFFYVCFGGLAVDMVSGYKT